MERVSAMTEADKLIQTGYDLCFGKGRLDGEKGREILLSAAAAGRSDAYYYIGRSLEKEDRYEDAAKNYEKGVNCDDRLSDFRLALLHGRGKLKERNRRFYLDTIRKLSRMGHIPATVVYTRERISGSYGMLGRLVGCLVLVPNLLRTASMLYHDPENPMFDDYGQSD